MIPKKLLFVARGSAGRSSIPTAVFKPVLGSPTAATIPDWTTSIFPFKKVSYGLSVGRRGSCPQQSPQFRLHSNPQASLVVPQKLYMLTQTSMTVGHRLTQGMNNKFPVYNVRIFHRTYLCYQLLCRRHNPVDTLAHRTRMISLNF